MVKLYLGTNLKMYKTISAVKAYLNDLQKLTSDIDREKMEIFVLPSYTTLAAAVDAVDKRYIKIGAQNMCWEETGQFTGEISPLMLKELNVDIVMAGHSERRHVFGETDSEENKKIFSALAHGFTALLCIGETKEEKQYNVSDEVLRRQLKIGLYNIEKKDIKNVMIGYEPVWSIGIDGEPASAEYAREKHAIIKDTLKELFGDEGTRVPVLYGGSVNMDNARQIISEKYIDGLYVGRSAWKAEKFNELIRSVKAAFDAKSN
ncbi:triose-phosphate isomerase [Pectinatus haikarae]|uniref:Triosephosphate isomerase n=1 Tax=Pectinatus haikarae TaxID=349096 RepID=A0ABT9YAQ5_9FIRM|nr:triose-phosphate isomerase [Pectinatus haikarae]MDQ0204616.1 triosephosphate isomerase [Pectinatus haikarae]